MNGLIDAAVNRSRTSLLLMAMVFIAGFASLRAIPIESEPNITVPFFQVMVFNEGISPEDAERLLVMPMEVELRSLEGIEKVEAQVGEGISFVTLTLAQSVGNVDVLVQEVRNELDTIQDLPDDVEEISIRKVEPQLPVIAISVFGETDERSIKQAANRLRDDLLNLPGVSKVQLSFIDYVAKPLWKNAQIIAPELHHRIVVLEDNRRRWVNYALKRISEDPEEEDHAPAQERYPQYYSSQRLVGAR